jgi:hypothetical protein
LIREIANNENPESARMMSCVICKNLISNKGGDQQYANIWINFDVPFKSFIKEAIIATLATQSKVVRSQVSSLIAAVAQIEIPR